MADPPAVPTTGWVGPVGSAQLVTGRGGVSVGPASVVGTGGRTVAHIEEKSQAMIMQCTGTIRADYHTSRHHPAHRGDDGAIFTLLGRTWTRVTNPVLIGSYDAVPAAELHAALVRRGYPDPMPVQLAASIAAKWGLAAPPLSPCETGELMPAAWICWTLAGRAVTAYAVEHDLPRYDAARWS